MLLSDLIPFLVENKNNVKIHFAQPEDALSEFLMGDFKSWQEEQNHKNFEKDYILSLIRLDVRDSSFAKPSYSTLTGTISWMIPLHINREFTEEPELVLVLRKAGEFYEIKTILPYDDETKDKLTDLSLYGRLW